MRKEERAIKILTDAEKVFREPPELFKYNTNGLCYYINWHLRFFTPNTKQKYIELIFGDKNWGGYLFTENRTQKMAWDHKIPGYNTDRADFCRKRIEELKKMVDAEPLSACCAAPFYEETDICTGCKEHGI